MVSTASSTTCSKSPGATTLPPTDTTASGPPGFSTIEVSAKSPGTHPALRYRSRNDPQNQGNPVILRITVQTSPSPLPPLPNPTAPSRASSRSWTPHSVLPGHRISSRAETLPPPGSTSPATSPTRMATYPTSPARPSTTFSKSPTTEQSSPPS